MLDVTGVSLRVFPRGGLHALDHRDAVCTAPVGEGSSRVYDSVLQALRNTTVQGSGDCLAHGLFLPHST